MKKRSKNWIRKNVNIFKLKGLYFFALSNRKRTISEKALDNPLLLQGFPIIVSHADFIG